LQKSRLEPAPGDLSPVRFLRRIGFAIEELPADVLFGTVIEANEQRLDAAAIRKLYESGAYPLLRRPLL
jgi:hypothetical protein